jgi:hypothetical protein
MISAHRNDTHSDPAQVLQLRQDDRKQHPSIHEARLLVPVVAVSSRERRFVTLESDLHTVSDQLDRGFRRALL